MLSKRILICLALFLMVTGCAPKMVSKIDKFPAMYEEMPQAILILPPINETTAADAKEHYSTTIEEPLIYTGFYVFPYEVTAEILKMEGIYDSELVASMPMGQFGEYFGADAVLFTTLKKWDLTYVVLASNLTISIDAILRSTKTDRTLWEYNGTIVVDLSGGNAGGGLAGLIAKAIVTAMMTAMADYVPYARMANYKALHAMPVGKYHPRHLQDQGDKVFDLKPGEVYPAAY